MVRCLIFIESLLFQVWDGNAWQHDGPAALSQTMRFRVPLAEEGQPLNFRSFLWIGSQASGAEDRRSRGLCVQLHQQLDS